MASVANLSPADAAERIAPGATIIFDLESTGVTPRVEDFESGMPSGWMVPTWSGWSDVWDVYDDSGNDVLRAQTSSAYAAILNTGHTVLYSPVIDIRVRMKWHTGARGGILARQRLDEYGLAGARLGPDSVFCEIDSGGLRLGWFTDGTRNLDQTSAFTPTDATWYWMRLQVAVLSGGSTSRYRAKYWTGDKSAEPGTWSIGWDYPSAEKGLTAERFWGVGLVAESGGNLYFDEWELLHEVAPEDLAKLVVEVNGTSLPVRAAPYYDSVTYESALMVPDIDNWQCRVNTQLAHDTDQEQTVVIKWDGTTISTTTFTTTTFPATPPDETGAGDPTGRSPFSLLSATSTQAVGMFSWVPLVFTFESRRELKYTIASITRRVDGENFEYIVYVPFATPVNGEYIIGHVVRTIVPSSVVPAELVWQYVPASIIPKGHRGEIFPASMVVQGYRRDFFPAIIIVGVQFFYRGKGSGVVGTEFLERISGAGVVFEVNHNNVVEVSGIDEETYAALVAAGVTWS
jgi:hypothetical protein